MISPPSEAGVEEVIVIAVLWLRLIIEAIGALVIGLGMCSPRCASCVGNALGSPMPSAAAAIGISRHDGAWEKAS
jgi:hypothetical protein